MASACRRTVQRISLSAIKSNVHFDSISRSVPISAYTAKSISFPLRPSLLSRIAPDLGCFQSMLPLHSTVAAARMTSCLSTTSRSCRALSQELGQSVPR